MSTRVQKSVINNAGFSAKISLFSTFQIYLARLQTEKGRKSLGIISCPSELLMSFFSNTVYDGKNVAKILHQLNILLLRLRRQQQQRRKCKKASDILIPERKLELKCKPLSSFYGHGGYWQPLLYAL